MLKKASRIMIDVDSEGYPTQGALDTISSYNGNIEHLIDGIIAVWHHKDFARKLCDGLYEFHTGGWSGNEALLEALLDNIRVRNETTCMSISGGHVILATRPDQESILYDEWFSMLGRLADYEYEKRRKSDYYSK